MRKEKTKEGEEIFFLLDLEADNGKKRSRGRK